MKEDGMQRCVEKLNCIILYSHSELQTNYLKLCSTVDLDNDTQKYFFFFKEQFIEPVDKTKVLKLTLKEEKKILNFISEVQIEQKLEIWCGYR